MLEAVSTVDEDLPEVTSPLDWDPLDLVSLDLVSLDRKLALERRRRFSKNGIMEGENPEVVWQRIDQHEGED